MKKKKLSPRQTRMLVFIGDFMDEHQYPPTVRDIQGGCEISSTSVVDYNLRILQREGHLRRDAEVSRGIELLGAASNAIPSPLAVSLVDWRSDFGAEHPLGDLAPTSVNLFPVPVRQEVEQGFGQRCWHRD